MSPVGFISLFLESGLKSGPVIAARLAPIGCSDAAQVLFKVLLDELTTVVVPVPLAVTEPLLESIGQPGELLVDVAA
jgi:hypothetical protein